MSTLLIVDGNALIHRAYHAIPDFKTSKGVPTNAVYGFASILHKVIGDLRPEYIIVCFDSKGPTFRDKLFKEYRAQRVEADRELKDQFPIVKEFLSCASLYYLEKEGLEADDIIGVVNTKAKKEKLKSIILTGDKDMFQLVDENTYVLTPNIGYSKGKLYGEQEVIKRFGIEPKYIPDLKALAGDPSDNYKGVAGIGPKTAVDLISKFGNIEEIYTHLSEIENENIRNKLIRDKENALLSKKLAVLDIHNDLAIQFDEAVFKGYNKDIADFFDKYQFRSLKSRFLKKKSTATLEKKSENTNQMKLF